MPEMWEAQSALETGAPCWALRNPPGAPDASTTSETRAETRDEEPAVLACATCREPVTTEAERMEVAGAHQHSFMNPHGFYYRIGCFAAAQALKAEGGWSGDWSWFPPCEWQIQRCARCDEHLGWLFRAAERRFYGLVLDRLIRLGSD
jgi:hypothetical protein